MKKRLTFLFLIAALTAGGISLFQTYWVYQTYKSGERNLNNLLLTALQKSIDNYQIQRSELPRSLKSADPYLSVLEVVPVDTTKHYKAFVKKAGDTLSLAKVREVPVNPVNLQRVKLMLAGTQFISASLMNKIDLDVLKKEFKNELKRNNIELPFQLVLLKSQQNLPPGKIAAYLNYSKNSPIVNAIFSNTDQILLIQNIIPFSVSLILILLSAGSLCYMWIIIRRQMKLDHIKNDFISNITHELRTPISILKSTNEALYRYDGIEEKEKALRYLQINEDILDKLDHNVDRILDITRYENGNKLARPVLVDIDEVIEMVIERFAIDDSSIIEFRNSHGLKEVFTDGYMIDTIVSNLIDNAIKYNNTEVSVSVTVNIQSNGWELIISDNGPGISHKDLPFIFDKFYRVPSGNLHEVKGYGLGLSYVKQLVSDLKGTISVSSKMNSGTTFTIKFPQL